MKKLENILILAGGQSSRIWPLSYKCLLPFGGISLMEYQLKFYAPYTKRIVIVANKRTKKAIERLAIKVNAAVVMQEGVGQAAAILSAKRYLAGETLIVNGADVLDVKLVGEVIAKRRESGCAAVLSARKVNQYFPGGYYKLKGDTIQDVVEKPGADNMPSRYFRLVVELYANIESFVETIGRAMSDRDDVFEKALSSYIRSEKNIRMVEYKGKFASLKYPWHVLGMMHFFLKKIGEHRGKNVSIDPTAKIIGDVYIDDGVKIYEYSKIVGPAYIGKNSIIGNYSLVLQSMIGEKCVVGGYAEVTRSYLGKDVWLHRNYIGDSVLGGENLFGAGAVTANYRFDRRTIMSRVKGEKIDSGLTKLGNIVGIGTKIGVNATLMPGIKVVSGARVMPGSVISRDVKK